MSDIIINCGLILLVVCAYILIPLLIRFKVDMMPMPNFKAKKILVFGFALSVVICYFIMTKIDVLEGISFIVALVVLTAACLVLYPIITKDNEDESDVKSFTGGCLISLLLPVAMFGLGIYFFTIIPDGSPLHAGVIGFMVVFLLGFPSFVLHKIFKNK